MAYFHVNSCLRYCFNDVEFTFSQHKNFSILFLVFFLLYSVIFLTIPVVREKNKLRLALDIPTSAPTILVKKQIDTPPVVVLKTIKTWSI